MGPFWSLSGVPAGVAFDSAQDGTDAERIRRMRFPARRGCLQQGDETRLVAFRNSAFDPEPRERERKGEPDQAAYNAVEPLPEEDELEMDETQTTEESEE